jgi:hypothetical protein
MKLKVETVGDLTLACDYWDCDCEENYIHPMTEKHCPLCGSDEDDMPNSMANEVAEHFGIPTSDFVEAVYGDDNTLT